MRFVRIKITGKVQGVFFRMHALKLAQKLNLIGMVMNLPGNAVLSEVYGDNDSVNTFIEWCRKGPAAARVDHIEITGLNEKPLYTTFAIINHGDA